MAGSNTFPLIIRKDVDGVKCLQELCRATILKTVTLKNAQQVATLPLPNTLKDFLCTFCIPEDFDLDGIFLDYNFNFPNHVHHKSHQIHPAKCLLDGSKILIKSEHSANPCKLCHSVGKKTMKRPKERETWLRVKHHNLINCHLRLNDTQSSLSCFLFDFPVLNLEDFVVKLFLDRKRIPEYLVWKSLKELVNVLQYLEKFGLHPWELCQPQHVVLSEEGTIKLENMLLYLPVKSGSHFQIDTTPSNSLSQYTSPEKLKGHTVGSHTSVWGLGCIMHELTADIPTVLLNSEHGFYFMPFSLKPGCDIYSKTLTTLIKSCSRLNTDSRPNLKQLQIKTNQQLKMLERSYKGPESLGELLPEIFG